MTFEEYEEEVGLCIQGEGFGVRVENLDKAIKRTQARVKRGYKDRAPPMWVAQGLLADDIARDPAKRIYVRGGAYRDERVYPSWVPADIPNSHKAALVDATSAEVMQAKCSDPVPQSSAELAAKLYSMRNPQ